MATLVLRNATTVDVDGESLRTSDVVVQSADDGEIDASGLYAMPGLVDMHVHLTGVVKSADPLGTARQNLQTFLHNGTTSVRDLGSPEEVAFQVLDEQPGTESSRSTATVAGPALSSPKGHGLWSGNAIAIEGQDEVLAVLHRLAERGARVVKVMAGSGSQPVGFPEMDGSLIAHVVASAHAHGIPVAVHANFRVDHICRALDAGCDTLEHGTVLCDVDPARRLAFAARQGAYCPTLSVLERLMSSTDSSEVVQTLKASCEANWEKAERSVRVAWMDGIPVVAGTDAGAYGVPYGSVSHEVRLLERAGLPRGAALRAATTTARRHATYPVRADSARPPLDDLILLRRNPLDDLEALDDLVCVIHRGLVSRLDETDRQV